MTIQRVLSCNYFYWQIMESLSPKENVEICSTYSERIHESSRKVSNAANTWRFDVRWPLGCSESNHVRFTDESWGKMASSMLQRCHKPNEYRTCEEAVRQNERYYGHTGCHKCESRTTRKGYSERNREYPHPSKTWREFFKGQLRSLPGYRRWCGITQRVVWNSDITTKIHCGKHLRWKCEMPTKSSPYDGR